jgi:hypothetical protein
MIDQSVKVPTARPVKAGMKFRLMNMRLYKPEC